MVSSFGGKFLGRGGVVVGRGEVWRWVEEPFFSQVEVDSGAVTQEQEGFYVDLCRDKIAS